MSELQTIQPDTRAVLDQLAAAGGPGLYEMPVSDARAAFRQLCSVLDLPAVDVPHKNISADDIPCRLYAPAQAHPASLIIYYHGGGWVYGDLQSHHSFCSWLSHSVKCRLLAVDYRLAPEHIFPAAHDDALKVVKWAATSPAILEGPVHVIGLAGDSAGGNLAATTALAVRDDTTIPVKAQLLIYPVTDLSSQSASYALHAEGYLLERATMNYFRDTYAPDATTHADARLSPLHADDVRGVAPAVILTCGLDPLRDEGRAYAARLVKAGVPVRFLEAFGQIHGVVTLRGAIASAQAPLAHAARDFQTLMHP